MGKPQFRAAFKRTFIDYILLVQKSPQTILTMINKNRFNKNWVLIFQTQWAPSSRKSDIWHYQRPGQQQSTEGKVNIKKKTERFSRGQGVRKLEMRLLVPEWHPVGHPSHSGGDALSLALVICKGQGLGEHCREST